MVEAAAVEVTLVAAAAVRKAGRERFYLLTPPLLEQIRARDETG